ncbi:unnamed protein product [Ambrosiozyma monospora]|uniref:Unnamed protein product n=1 Tax=Ambrosiozyma monospora TaxID=43982 RepID=A0ACB5TWG5_AMBMO|nr:unnamed protein product [Ambrosiozyma monospora]
MVMGKSREAPLQPPPSYVEEVYGDYDEDTCGGIGTSVNSLPLGKKRDIFKNRNLDTSGYSNDVKVGDGEVVYYENEEEAKLGEMGGDRAADVEKKTVEITGDHSVPSIKVDPTDSTTTSNYQDPVPAAETYSYDFNSVSPTDHYNDEPSSYADYDTPIENSSNEPVEKPTTESPDHQTPDYDCVYMSNKSNNNSGTTITKSKKKKMRKSKRERDAEKKLRQQANEAAGTASESFVDGNETFDDQSANVSVVSEATSDISKYELYGVPASLYYEDRDSWKLAVKKAKIKIKQERKLQKKKEREAAKAKEREQKVLERKAKKELKLKLHAEKQAKKKEERRS